MKYLALSVVVAVLCVTFYRWFLTRSVEKERERAADLEMLHREYRMQRTVENLVERVEDLERHVLELESKN